MAINVTSGNADDNKQRNGNRCDVTNSSGIPYVVVENQTDESIDVWKADGTVPTSFSEQDAGSKPSASVYGSCDAAISSDDIIHISYMRDNGKTSSLRYVTFDTGTDTFSGDTSVIADIGADPGSINNLYTSIHVDHNDIPIIIYTEYRTNMGTDFFTIFGLSRHGGSWDATGDQIEGVNNGVDCVAPSSACDASGLSVVSYINSTDNDVGTAISNSNNFTSFTIHDIDTDASQTSTEQQTCICVNSAGDHFVTYEDHSDGFIYLIRHDVDDAWTTWQARVTGSATGINPSMVADGTDLHLFFEDGSNDISYEKVTGGTVFEGDSTLETGTYNTAKTKWGYWVDNDSTGSLITQTTYCVDGSDAAATDPDGVWTDETNSDDCDIDTDATTASTGSSASNYIQIEGTAAPASGDDIIGAIGRIHNGTDWSSFGIISPPTGGWTYASAQALEVRVYVQLAAPSQLTVQFFADGDAGGTVLGQVGIIYIAFSKVEVALITRAGAVELAYTFADETASTDILWNSLTIAAAVGNIKTVDTIAIANVKTIDGVDIANVASRDTITN